MKNFNMSPLNVYVNFNMLSTFLKHFTDFLKIHCGYFLILLDCGYFLIELFFLPYIHKTSDDDKSENNTLYTV